MSTRPVLAPGGCISTSNPSSADGNKKIKRLLALTPAIRSACDLDLLLFLHRHPRTLLTSAQLAAFVGYDIKEIAESLDVFLEADFFERTQHPMHAARMYLLVLDGPQHGGLRELLKLASTRNGRHGILQALDSGGSPFSEAAKWYIEGFSERSGIPTNVNIVDVPQRLPVALELALFRILQEGLVNVHRHSHSESVDIQLEFSGNKVLLEIRDHGQGVPRELLDRFRSKDKLGGGVGGLSTMSGRTRELGGSFEIESDKNGTLIRVSAPVPFLPRRSMKQPQGKKWHFRT